MSVADSIRDRVGSDSDPNDGAGSGLKLVTLLTYLFLYGPILVVVLMSFDAGRYGLRWDFTTEWYASLATRSDLIDSLWLSIQIGIVVMIISTVLAVVAAFGLSRFDWPKRKGPIATYLIFVPLTLPIIIYGIGLYVFFTQLGIGRGFFPIVVGHVLYTLPFATLVVGAGVIGLDRTLEEAAMDLGADPLTTFREVTLPALMPNIVAAALFSFTLSFDEFLISFFVSGGGAVPLPVRIWGMVRADIEPEVYAISVVVLLISIAIAGMATRLRRF
ncbi:ABC-type transport system permease protein (plasmid) [Natrialba magadii ATCC 43099]|uniref:ABC-type transport system permease protein n=1 Tax=Natrialba magadii (strain ATCC 43099 / DSM 3394 / CCM 3739 / CIP 104546 / IAM 13178 / JCM 8861 / NBRC 102185 / NCIMB 2190 / MS3) TaxID=547559 RepID=D3T1D6_NATMM|nr:ABC transporter permease [Natrialba magadii]ADD07395.1 ABC-type transport system permease protein [Natrialba magadii ATCC 43099]ELY32419.1 binding-protein-dependent transport system inner membrane protein [Natrialba magadii ATCC 43099]